MFYFIIINYLTLLCFWEEDITTYIICTCVLWKTWTYYICFYLSMVNQVDVLHVFYLCTMDYVDVLPVFLAVHNGLTERITCISTCAWWIKCIYYLYFYLCTMDYVDELHVFLPIYSGSSGRITCISTCARWIKCILHVFLPVHGGSSGCITLVSTCVRWTKWTYYLWSYLCTID